MTQKIRSVDIVLPDKRGFILKDIKDMEGPLFQPPTSTLYNLLKPEEWPVCEPEPFIRLFDRNNPDFSAAYENATAHNYFMRLRFHPQSILRFDSVGEHMTCSEASLLSDIVRYFIERESPFGVVEPVHDGIDSRFLLGYTGTTIVVPSSLNGDSTTNAPLYASTVERALHISGITPQ